MRESDSSDNSKYIKSKSKKSYKNIKHRKRTKQDLSDSLSSNSDKSNENDYKSKRRNKKKKYWKNKWDPIELCAKLTAKLLAKAYKSKNLKLKLDKDPLQHWIHFLTFIESLYMIFSQYRETCEILLHYPTIVGEDMC